MQLGDIKSIRCYTSPSTGHSITEFVYNSYVHRYNKTLDTDQLVGRPFPGGRYA